jgi:hypothetical protein
MIPSILVVAAAVERVVAVLVVNFVVVVVVDTVAPAALQGEDDSVKRDSCLVRLFIITILCRQEGD